MSSDILTVRVKQSKLNDKFDSQQGNSGALVNYQNPLVPEEDPIPGLFHSDQKKRINLDKRSHYIYLTKQVWLAPECHTVVPVYYRQGIILRPRRNSVLIEPNRNQTLLNKNRLFLHPGIYTREGYQMKVLITNFGNKPINLPRRLKVELSYEGKEEHTQNMNVLEPSQPLQVSPIQLAERRGYVIEQLNISENTVLHGEVNIQEKLIQLFLDNWNAVSIQGSDDGELDTTIIYYSMIGYHND